MPRSPHVMAVLREVLLARFDSMDFEPLWERQRGWVPGRPFLRCRRTPGTFRTVEPLGGSRGSLGGQPSMCYAYKMILHSMRVVAVVVATWLAPSLAYAHGGHAHHADHASAPAGVAAPATAGHQDQVSAPAIAQTAIARAPSAIDRAGCVGHCCSGV